MGITGVENEFYPTRFPVTLAASASTGVQDLAAAQLWAGGQGAPVPPLHIDGRHAAVAFRSERYLRINHAAAPDIWEPLSGYYRTRDDRWFLLHANVPAHRKAALEALGGGSTRADLETAIGAWWGEALEDALAEVGGAGAVMRNAEQWAVHPQSQAVRTLPVLEITRVGDAPPRPWAPAERPLQGVRVLDLTRVIAGPVAGRTLAGHGATVLRVGSPHLWDGPTLVIDTGFGKWSAHLDLDVPDQRVRLQGLAADADVVIQAYRPGALASRGLSPTALIDQRPGLVYVTISAYGRVGPWSARRGFDSLVQMASGIVAEGTVAGGTPDGPPIPLPAQALDHATGYLAAFGAMVALDRQRREGGSWHVALSLAQTGAWFTDLGRVAPRPGEIPHGSEIDDLLDTCDSSFGALDYVRPVGGIATMKPRWTRPPVELGADPPAWPS